MSTNCVRLYISCFKQKPHRILINVCLNRKRMFASALRKNKFLIFKFLILKDLFFENKTHNLYSFFLK